MEELIVLKKFRDSLDRYIYEAGDDYPREDSPVLEFKPERLAVLKDGGYIGVANDETEETEEVVEEEQEATADSDYPKHTGGGVYELSDGSTVKGKKAAQEAEDALKKAGE